MYSKIGLEWKEQKPALFLMPILRPAVSPLVPLHPSLCYAPIHLPLPLYNTALLIEISYKVQHMEEISLRHGLESISRKRQPFLSPIMSARAVFPATYPPVSLHSYLLQILSEPVTSEVPLLPSQRWITRSRRIATTSLISITFMATSSYLLFLHSVFILAVLIVATILVITLMEGMVLRVDTMDMGMVAGLVVEATKSVMEFDAELPKLHTFLLAEVILLFHPYRVRSSCLV
ncbi:hypothetical protein BDP27DRAFT_1322884 [Rhodocollybia butyracea]|uniref:Uncharacterized protein n=1 Tax=Rhodocollybia butyracea TaxID=206335 RepID=A0A9P5PX88_9AGAR|nr:hypothetical protein BDP27DRAFT_1322884 [Rhodocollybia butyracea]